MLVLARRDERSREEAEAKALGAKTLGAKAPKAKALETEALEAKEDEREAEVGAAKMPRVQKKRRTQAEGTSYTVGSLAKLAGVTVRALHHYEDEGCCIPSARPAAIAVTVRRMWSGCSRFCCCGPVGSLSAPFATPSLMTVSTSVRCSPTTLPRCARGKKNWKL